MHPYEVWEGPLDRPVHPAAAMAVASEQGKKAKITRKDYLHREYKGTTCAFYHGQPWGRAECAGIAKCARCGVRFIHCIQISAIGLIHSIHSTPFRQPSPHTGYKARRSKTVEA